MRAKAGRGFVLAAALTALIVVSRLQPSAPALLDAATGLPVPGVRLEFPALHLALTPLSSLADVAACSSARQAAAFILLLIASFGAFRWAALGHGRREWFAAAPVLRGLSAYGCLCAVFLAWGVLWPRAPARLIADDPDLLPVDFHSHTSHSWDGRSWYTPARNLDWHERSGFGAVFITDHNRVDGATAGARLSRVAWDSGRRDGAAAFMGEELSLHDAHVLLFGAEAFVDPAAYPGERGLQAFLARQAPRRGGLAVMSLPEYHRHHRHRLEDLADWGAEGFELVSASPKGLDVSPAFRKRVAELCRARGLFVTGGSDNHGYGSTSCVWSLVRVPGWRELAPPARQDAVLASLRRDGYSAVQVVARARALEQPPADWRLWLDGPAAVWRMLRAWTPLQAGVALAWIWGAALVAARLFKVTSTSA